MPRGGPVFRQVAPKAPAGNSIVASAQVFAGANVSQSLVKKIGGDLEWERILWDMYDTVPEYRFGVDWVGASLSKAKIGVHYNGQPTTEQAALDAVASLFDGPEGQAEMLRLLGVHFTVAGEAWVVGTPGSGSEPDEWKVIAATSVTGTTGNLKINNEPVPAGTIPVRVWKAHPKKPNQANSPSRALIPVLSELTMLTKVVAAQGESRLTSAGILWVPSEIELPGMPVTQFFEDGDDEEAMSMQSADGATGLYNRMIHLAKIAIANRESAAAQIPLVVAAPGEFLEKIQKTEFWSGFDEHAKTLRDEAIRRIAIGMDMPPEVITGTADVNHWGSWAIEEASIKATIEPLLGLILASLDHGYLRPWLRSEGIADPENYTFVADTSSLRMRPNRSKESVELWDRGILSGRVVLVENGFDPETDAMDDTERVMWLYAKAAGGSTTPDQVAAAMNALGATLIPRDNAEPRDERPAPSLVEHPSREIPREEDSESKAIAASGAFVIDGVLLASEAWVRQALRRAGNRLKNKVGLKTGTPAPDLYLSVNLSATEAKDLLVDAWDDLDYFEYPGVDCQRLKTCLDEYTLTLLRLQKPHRRESLARHLLLELAE